MGDYVGYIIVGIVALVPLSMLGVFIAARLKGKLELNLAKGGYAPGETITGTLKFTAKKTLEGKRLFVALVGYEEITSTRDGKTRTDRHEVYRREFDLRGAGPIAAGTEESHEFQIATPGVQKIQAEAEDSSLLGKAAGALAAGFKAIGNSNRRKIWEVQARYDIKGIDLTTKRQVTISGI